VKIIQAIIRPEKEKEVLNNLEKAGIPAFTRLDVTGRGRQRGIQIGAVRYDELAKVWLLVIVKDDVLERALETIKIAARTGNPGDGKIFVSSLSESRTLRTRSNDKA
jgi:nitrogen regulatory protein PII 1